MNVLEGLFWLGVRKRKPRKRSPQVRGRERKGGHGLDRGDGLDRCYVCWDKLDRARDDHLNGTCYTCVLSGKLERDPITRLSYEKCAHCDSVLVPETRAYHGPLCALDNFELLIFAKTVEILLGDSSLIRK